MDTFDIIVIGGGPNGLYAAYKLSKKFENKRLLILEKGRILNSLRQIPDVLWHSCMRELKLPSYLNEQIVDDYNPITSELVRYYEAFAREHQFNLREHHEVTNLAKGPDGIYEVEAKPSSGVSVFVRAKIVLICSGNFSNTRKLEKKSDYPFCVYGMSTKECGKNLVLVGAGNSAADYIIHLLPKNKIHWVIRGTEWRAINSNLSETFNTVMERYKSNLTLYENANVAEVFPDHRVLLSDGTMIADIDQCNILIGYHSRNAFFDRIGLAYDHECLKLGPAYETNLSNVYAFGSIMARWDAERSAPAPTYIHNGNNRELELIINDIIRKEIADIMDSTVTQAMEPDAAPLSLLLRAARKHVRTIRKRLR